MVQTLATMLMTHVQRPSLQHCRIVAKALTTMYEFLKDDEGDDEVRKLMCYVHNVSSVCTVVAKPLADIILLIAAP